MPRGAISARGVEMRSGLRWLLAATLLASGFALLYPENRPQIVAAVGSAEVGRRATSSVDAPLPATLPMLRLEAAGRDPFSSPRAEGTQGRSAPEARVVQQAPALPASGVLPVQGVAPPQPSWKYFGRMTSPGGRVITLLTRGEQPVAVETGMSLGDGYKVEALDEHHVRLAHALSGVQYAIPIPLLPVPRP